MGNLIEVLSKSDKFKFLSDAIKVSGMSEILSSEGPYTLLAPTDYAFAKSSRKDLSELMENREKLRSALMNHTLKGSMSLDQIIEKLGDRTYLELRTLGGEKVTLKNNGVLKKEVVINGATVVTANLEAGNGIIHAVDGFLVKQKEKTNSSETED